jgi:hypothetical protein
MRKFKKGDHVQITATETGSVNKTGDEGTITEVSRVCVDDTPYRVEVVGRDPLGNWQSENQLTLVD